MCKLDELIGYDNITNYNEYLDLINVNIVEAFVTS